MRFNLKFSPSNPRDVQLYEWIRADTTSREVNISGVIKDLLYAWYVLRWRLRRLPVSMVADLHETPQTIVPVSNGNGHIPALPEPEEAVESPDDPLVQRMVGLNFDGFK